MGLEDCEGCVGWIYKIPCLKYMYEVKLQSIYELQYDRYPIVERLG